MSISRSAIRIYFCTVLRPPRHEFFPTITGGDGLVTQFDRNVIQDIDRLSITSIEVATPKIQT